MRELTEIHVGLGPEDLSLSLFAKVSTHGKQQRIRCSSNTYKEHRGTTTTYLFLID